MHVESRTSANGSGPALTWTQWGLASRLIARLVKPRQPSVLVLSMARSGSSWVGGMLGCAPDAAYLREPVTQSDTLFYRKGGIFPLDEPEVEAAYRRQADKAFQGWPEFAEK